MEKTLIIQCLTCTIDAFEKASCAISILSAIRLSTLSRLYQICPVFYLILSRCYRSYSPFQNTLTLCKAVNIFTTEIYAQFRGCSCQNHPCKVCNHFITWLYLVVCWVRVLVALTVTYVSSSSIQRNIILRLVHLVLASWCCNCKSYYII